MAERIESTGTNFKRDYHQYAQVMIGDEDRLDGFRPCVDLLLFGRETRGRLYLPKALDDPRHNDRLIAPTNDGERLEWWDATGNVGFRMFDAPVLHPITGFSRSYERGCAEVELVIGAEPPGRAFEMPFEMTGLRAFHQPALTAQEIADGAFRPDHIIDSYAVYHATKGVMHRAADADKYRTSKAFHLERFTYRDANGLTGWLSAVLVPPVRNVHNGRLRITLPAGLAYPVMVGPTFGQTSAGASDAAIGDIARLAKATPTDGDGTLNFVGAFITNSSALGKDMQAAIYAYTSDTNAGAKIASSAASLSVPTQTDADTQFTLSAALTNNTPYFIGVQSQAAGGLETVCFDASGGFHVAESGITFPSWSDPFNETNNSTALLSVYGDYTAAGGGGNKTRLTLMGCS